MKAREILERIKELRIALELTKTSKRGLIALIKGNRGEYIKALRQVEKILAWLT